MRWYQVRRFARIVCMAALAAAFGCHERPPQPDPPPATVALAPATAPAAAPLVVIDNFNFSPEKLVVPRGTRVTWVNRDDVPHTVTSTAKLFDSKALDTDERFSHQFDQPGTYPYFCAVHPQMTAQVIVQ